MKRFFTMVLSFSVCFGQSASGQPRSTPSIELGSINVTGERVDALISAVNGCYPEPSWIERTGATVTLKANAGYRQKSSNAFVLTEGTSNFIGVSVSVPLYSAQDVERDRTRELTRRKDVADAIGQYIDALGNLGSNRAYVVLMQNHVKWVEARVSEGIAPTTDQVQAVQALAGEARTEIKGIAGYHASRARLLALCPSNAVERVQAVMWSLESGADVPKVVVPELPKMKQVGGAP